MTLPDLIRKEMAAIPPGLRALLEAELVAGNSIEEVGHSFPAPPVGAYFKLARPLLTRPRASGDGIDYYLRNSSLYSGEITDAKRFFFLLEPPAPPPPEPNMAEIRAIHTPKYQMPTHRPDTTSLVTRFRKSMVIDYEKWHDGIGYDLALIKSASAEERVEIERILLDRRDQDWRDIEALAALDSPAARKALKEALRSPKQEISVAVMSYATDLLSGAERVRTLVTALREAEFYGGLTQALLQVQSFHPPEIVAALFRGALERKDGVGVHFAAMLLFIHGKATSAFDWSQRPFLLRLNAAQRDARELVFLELCDKIGSPAETFARAVRTARTLRGQSPESA